MTARAVLLVLAALAVVALPAFLQRDEQRYELGHAPDHVASVPPGVDRVPPHHPPGVSAQSTSRPRVAVVPVVGELWDALAQCESGGDWTYNGPSGFDGGLQFHPGTWTAYAPAGFPEHAYEASRDQQITVATLVLDAQGWGAWPTCARKLGLLA